MTRPQMIRADTLDLQDHDTPSAKDHSKQPEHPEPLGSGRPAPHQELSIRHADQDSKSEINGGPDKNVYREPDNDEDEDGDYDHEDGDLADGESDDLMDDDLMDKISSSPSIDDEDIDFEFVYALHNFVATVDGQANAAKGDTMVLLDDSNSYWWLVRVVKDGSIGYLPAEHIETPTERLARLNKHRNVDLSATMLGDNNEKSKNPLKKAMRRRNAKNVNFAPPTYIEASDVEYSSDEDSENGDFFNDDETLDGEEEDAQAQTEDIVVEPLRPKGQKDKTVEYTDVHGSQAESQRSSSDRRPSSEEFFESEEPTVSRSRNGTVRNTDSFFKDDTAEPKKISLTPNLLRDESGGGGGSSGLAEWKEPRGSFESIEKGSSLQDKLKEDKKRKDKKPGMLSGLFKRKKSKDEVEDGEKSPEPKTSMESISSKSLSPEQRPIKHQPQSQKDTNKKLQKQPPGIMKVDTEFDPAIVEYSKHEPKQSADKTIRKVTSQEEEAFEECDIVLSSPVSQSSLSRDPFATPAESRDALASPVERTSSEAQWRAPSEIARAAGSISVTSPPQKFTPKFAPRDHEPESPVNISPVEGYIPVGAPGLTLDASPQGVRSLSPPSPPSSPGADTNYHKGNTATPASMDTLSVDTPTWSDSSLRSYMDEENDIRDLFIIVHDKSNVPPAGPDHPITGRLFKEESKRLKEMNNQLDEMLVNWMSQRTNNSASARSMQSPI
ncbi:hypothetical protein PENANT_c009G01032 [Penicillium antarcticum]|uniref:SH3 domain-containing protein n=1 Tax=Penicillium antarcticum TaxID=416450 RepID=A0A1V6Q947_9EURO|nr:uncharacterized protein N7508_006329 [Penicillium antarcticum]KAJ5301466.1 hypothetical protein N7508_006329 [Penicillium antarcticum]OQD85761.1 hypothetical protein PENANT_c009G01032 [Penicillium antarcticum]